MCYSVNVSYVSLSIRPAKEPGRVEGDFFFPNTACRCPSQGSQQLPAHSYQTHIWGSGRGCPMASVFSPVNEGLNQMLQEENPWHRGSLGAQMCARLECVPTLYSGVPVQSEEIGNGSDGLAQPVSSSDRRGQAGGCPQFPALGEGGGGMKGCRV